MSATLLPDALWDLVKPFLPISPLRPTGGRPRVSDRACLTGIVFVLRSGIPWQMLPQELECGSGMTCWRRLRDWQLAGVWDLIHFALLDWLARCDQIDWSRAVVDSCSIRAVYVGNQTGPNSYRSGQAREQAASDLRRPGHAARHPAERGQPA
jgi:transposase